MKATRSVLLPCIFILGSILLRPASGTAATAEQDFINGAQTDYQNLSDTINGTFAKSMGFFTSLGWNSPSEVFDLVAGPRLELGIGLGADLINLPNLNSVSLSAIDLKSNLNIPGVVPAPFPVITGRVGLMNGLDLGVKFNYLPLVNIPQLGFGANFFGWGVDLRYKLLDGVYNPDITAGISFDDMSGNLNISTAINQTGSYTDGGTTYNNITLTGNNVYNLNWNTKSFGAQVQIGKNLGMIFPFAAVGFQRNSGTIVSTMSGNGTLTIPSPGSGTPTAVNINAVSSAAPVLFEPKFVAGFDMGIGLHWAVVAESNGTDIAGSTSFRLQF